MNREKIGDKKMVTPSPKLSPSEEEIHLKTLVHIFFLFFFVASTAFPLSHMARWLTTLR